jgi:hypothetical protein
MHGVPSEAELFTIDPRLVGSPNAKSAFATPTTAPNTKTIMSKVVFFILLPFQRLLIFTRHTRCAALFEAFVLLKNRLSGLIGPNLINRKMGAN